MAIENGAESVPAIRALVQPQMNAGSTGVHGEQQVAGPPILICIEDDNLNAELVELGED
jgi:hypothetical protein